jgi:hypothetical protein
MICAGVTNMKLSVALLLYELRKGENPPEIQSEGLRGEHAAVSGIRILRRETFKEDVVYISAPDDIRNVDPLPPHVFVAGLPDSAGLSGVVYINLSEGELTNAVQDIFYRYDQIDCELGAAIARNESLRTVLSICARFFNNPITINDLRMRFIETSDNVVRELMPDYFKVVLDTGYIDIRIMIAMKNKGYDRLINSTGETLLFELEEIPVRYFSKNIYEGGQIVACVVVHEVFCPIHIAQTILVEQVTQVVDAYAFNSPRGKQTSVNKIEQVVRTLLEGSKFNEEIHALYLRQINWGVEDGYYIIKIMVSPENVTMKTTQYTFAWAQSHFPGSLMIENEDYGVLVVCAEQIRYDFDQALAQLETYLSERRDKAAVSRKFGNFGMLYEQYRALSSAMQLGMVLNPDRHLYHFDAYSLPVMLKTCSRDFDLRVFCTYEAVTLYDYDKSNGSEFFKSLYVYLRHNRGLVSAAAELKVHRNTLLYRIGRAAEISGLNPSDDDIILPALLSYEILHYRLMIE